MATRLSHPTPPSPRRGLRPPWPTLGLHFNAAGSVNLVNPISEVKAYTSLTALPIVAAGVRADGRCAYHGGMNALSALLAAAALAALPAPAPPPGASLVASPEKGWPQWRGPRRDGVSDEKGLLQAWPAEGPKQLWFAGGLGRGYSSPIIAGARLFITGDVGPELRIFAFDLQGKPLWQAANGKAWTGSYPGSRSSCAYRAGRLYHKNSHGRVAFLDPATGREIWAVETAERFGVEQITWGLSECLLVDEGRVYVTVGVPKAMMAALDARTGSTLWASEPILCGASSPPQHLRVAEPAGKPDSSSYASPILLTLGKRRLLVQCSLRHAFCVDADDGKLLWTRPLKTQFDVIGITPTVAGGGVFVTGPDSEGGKLYRLAEAGGTVTAEEAWSTTLDTCHGGVVAVGGRLYSSWYRKPAWGCLDAATGREVAHCAERDMGSLTYADGRLYMLSQSGGMMLARPTAAGFEVVSRFPLVQERRDDVWAHPVICAGRLYLRSHETLRCYDVRAKQPAR